MVRSWPCFRMARMRFGKFLQQTCTLEVDSIYNSAYMAKDQGSGVRLSTSRQAKKEWFKKDYRGPAILRTLAIRSTRDEGKLQNLTWLWERLQHHRREAWRCTDAPWRHRGAAAAVSRDSEWRLRGAPWPCIWPAASASTWIGWQKVDDKRGDKY